MPISDKAVIRVSEQANLIVDDTAYIDDDVRIVMSNNASLKIGRGSKIGKGTIINCGGKIVIGKNVSIYGYCYLQTSKWTLNNKKERIYYHSKIIIDDDAVISPYCIICYGGNVAKGDVIEPYSKIGDWSVGTK